MIGCELIGATEAHERLTGIADRYMLPEADYGVQIEALEQNERDVFAQLHGRYVNTGATRDSLTSSGGDAIRDIEGSELVFGTRVWYARFLTRIITSDDRRVGGSAVLRVSYEHARLMASQQLNYFVNGARNVLQSMVGGDE